MTDNEIASMYDEKYYFFQRSDRSEIARTQSQLRRIIHLIDTGDKKRVLDVGSAKGYGLRILKQLGWEVQGIELATAAANFAERTLGVSTFNGTIEDFLEKKNGQYPTVLVLDVLEHIPYPIEFLETLSSIVECGGMVIFDTPNGAAKRISILKERWEGFNPFHIFIYNPSNLAHILGRFGFSAEGVITYSGIPTRPAKTYLKSMLKKGLLKTGMIPTFKRVRRILEGQLDRITSLDAKIRRASLDLQSQRETNGGTKKDCGDDNFILVARKIC